MLVSLISTHKVFSNTNEPSVLIYSLPKTELHVCIVAEKITETPGQFFRYSERYLATNNVITEPKTFFKLKSVSVTPQAIPDPNRTYSFSPGKKSNVSRLSVDEKGILQAVNIVSSTYTDKKYSDSSATANKPSSAFSILPLGEEYMMAGSEAKLAEGAAKQIYHIRESRLGILTADVDRLPADGASFETVMAGLNTLEAQLTELFVGKTNIETTTTTIYFAPEATINKEVLFRLSAFSGVVAKDDLSGTPYYISVLPIELNTTVSDLKVKNETSALFYIQPAPTQIIITDGEQTLYNKKLDIPQLGKVIPLSKNFVEQENIKIKFDTNTGRLLSVE